MSELWDKIRRFAAGDLGAIQEEPEPLQEQRANSFNMPSFLQESTSTNRNYVRGVPSIAQKKAPKRSQQQYKRPEIPNYVTPVGKGLMSTENSNAPLTPAQEFVQKATGKVKDTLTYWGVGRKIEERYSDKWWSVEDAYKRGQNITKWDSDIQKYAKQYDVDPYLIKGIIITESRGNPLAKSPAGAVGLAQAMPATAKEFGLADRTNPEQSIKFLAKYMKYLTDYWQKRGYPDKELATEMAIASYNWGMGSVGQHLQGKRDINDEALNYLPQVKWHTQIAREANL